MDATATYMSNFWMDLPSEFRKNNAANNAELKLRGFGYMAGYLHCP